MLLLIAIKKSKGKIIFLLDSDDYFNKKKLSIIVKKFIDDDKLEFLQDIPVFSDNNKNYYLRKKIHFFFNFGQDFIQQVLLQ